MDLVKTFSRLDVRVNFGELVSWQGFTQALIGEENQIASVIGWGFAAATVLAISWVWYAGGRNAEFSAQLALASVCIVLISPHTLYYDSGIALIAVVVLFNRFGDLNPGLVLAVWATGLLQLLSPAVGLSLSFIPLVLILAVAVRYLWKSGAKNAAALPA